MAVSGVFRAECVRIAALSCESVRGNTRGRRGRSTVLVDVRRSTGPGQSLMRRRKSRDEKAGALMASACLVRGRLIPFGMVPRVAAYLSLPSGRSGNASSSASFFFLRFSASALRLALPVSIFSAASDCSG